MIFTIFLSFTITIRGFWKALNSTHMLVNQSLNGALNWHYSHQYSAVRHTYNNLVQSHSITALIGYHFYITQVQTVSTMVFYNAQQ